jgi:hypothetical protein
MYTPPLPSFEIRSIARSIAKYTWRHREWLSLSDSRKRDGIMGFEPIAIDDPVARAAEIQRRQRAGSAFTAELKRNRIETAFSPYLLRGSASPPLGALSLRGPSALLK